jgi:hypothetical protein
MPRQGSKGEVHTAHNGNRRCCARMAKRERHRSFRAAVPDCPEQPTQPRRRAATRHRARRTRRRGLPFFAQQTRDTQYPASHSGHVPLPPRRGSHGHRAMAGTREDRDHERVHPRRHHSQRTHPGTNGPGRAQTRPLPSTRPTSLLPGVPGTMPTPSESRPSSCWPELSLSAYSAGRHNGRDTDVGVTTITATRPLALWWHQMGRSSGYDNTGSFGTVGRVEPL